MKIIKAHYNKFKAEKQTTSLIIYTILSITDFYYPFSCNSLR